MRPDPFVKQRVSEWPTVLRYLIIFIIACLLMSLAACATRLHYTGISYYYTGPLGVKYECREPEPYLGGNCKSANMWIAEEYKQGAQQQFNEYRQNH